MGEHAPDDYDPRIPEELRELAAAADLPAPSLYAGRLYEDPCPDGMGDDCCGGVCLSGDGDA